MIAARKWTRKKKAGEVPAPEAAPAASDDEYANKLDDELDELD